MKIAFVVFVVVVLLFIVVVVVLVALVVVVVEFFVFAESLRLDLALASYRYPLWQAPPLTPFVCGSGAVAEFEVGVRVGVSGQREDFNFNLNENKL